MKKHNGTHFPDYRIDMSNNCNSPLLMFTKHQKTTTTTKYAYRHQCTYSCIKRFPSGDPPMIKISFKKNKNNNKKNVKNTHFKRSLIWISKITYMLLRSLEVKLNSIKFIRNYSDLLKYILHVLKHKRRTLTN